MNKQDYQKAVGKTSSEFSWACSQHNLPEVGRLAQKLRCRYGLTYAQIVHASGVLPTDCDEMLYLSEADSDSNHYGY
jgi:hypothetical protein